MHLGFLAEYSWKFFPSIQRLPERDSRTFFENFHHKSALFCPEKGKCGEIIHGDGGKRAAAAAALLSIKLPLPTSTYTIGYINRTLLVQCSAVTLLHGGKGNRGKRRFNSRQKLRSPSCVLSASAATPPSSLSNHTTIAACLLPLLPFSTDPVSRFVGN